MEASPTSCQKHPGSWWETLSRHTEQIRLIQFIGVIRVPRMLEPSPRGSLRDRPSRADPGAIRGQLSTPAKKRSRSIESWSCRSVRSISCAAPSTSSSPARIEIATWFR